MKPLLLVDGYNIIGAWERVRREGWTHAEAREALIERMADYAGYSAQEVILVFDGGLSERRVRTQERISGITVVFTMHGETADQYIEATCDKTPRYREVRVATSDGIEQTVTMGRGATRLSAREMLIELSHVRKSGRKVHTDPKAGRNTLDAQLPPDIREALERMRRGK